MIAVKDSGLYHHSPFFHDIDLNVTLNEKMDNHRKIVRYDTRDDGIDEDGHGTHVAGTALGSIAEGEENPPKIARFEGIAPQAKLHMIQGFISFSLDEEVELMKDSGAKISSNSWGSTITISLPTVFAYDKLSYENPDILWVFAAGNENLWMCSPGFSKNVLTVAATTLPVGAAATNQENNKQFYYIKFHKRGIELLGRSS